MTTAASVLQRARDLHPAFTPAQTPDAVALRFLQGARDRLYQEAARANRAAFLRVVSAPFTAAALADGIPLPPAVWIGNCRARVTDAPGDETMPVVFRERPDLTLSYTVALYATVEQALVPAVPPATQGTLEDRLQLYPKAADRWGTVSAILVDYLPILTPLTGLAVDLELPDFALEPLVHDLAVFMAKRGPASADAAQPPTAAFAADAAQARASFLLQLGEARRPKLSRIREGW